MKIRLRPELQARLDELVAAGMTREQAVEALIRQLEGKKPS